MTSTLTSPDIGVFDMRAGTTRPWLKTDFENRTPRFSPDGTWVAYTSNASGRFEVYVRPFEGGSSVAVSSNRGTSPVWRGDGRELFFLGADGALMAVDVRPTRATVETGRPHALFRIPLNDITADLLAPYDVAPDGRRFLLNVPDRPEPLLFVQGLSAIVR